MDDPFPIAAKAQIPNAALQPLNFLIGEWLTTGWHPMMPGNGIEVRTSFNWHEAELPLDADAGRRARVSDGLASIGSDDVAGTFAMTYFDERGISRFYEVTVGDRTVTWRRDDPKLF